MGAKLYINLRNMKYNIEQFERKLFNNQELLVMIKADAYGAGIVESAKALESVGVKHFGVAYLKEAKLLRENNIKGNITVFSGLVPNEYEEAVKIDAIYSVSNFETLESINNIALHYNKTVKVEIAIDTGMTRLGFDICDTKKLCEKLKNMNGIMTNGVYSHLSKADSDDLFTKDQIKRFNECIEVFKKENIEVRYFHILNTAGILKYNDNRYNMVRLGIGAYGYLPDESFKHDICLKKIFKLSAPVCNIREVKEGREVSYSGTFITNKDTKIAVLQIGYADGLTRSLSNKANVTINGKNAKIIGNICMDTCMVDVTDINVNIGNEAVIFNYNDDFVESIADLTGTINYEIITNIGKRVDRIYVDE